MGPVRAIQSVFVPYLGAMVRRLHDTGRSGLWYFIAVIPFGFIVLYVLLALPGDKAPNRYGTPTGATEGAYW